MGATAPPPTDATLDPEICINLMRNMQGEIGGGGVRRLFARSGFYCITVYNVGMRPSALLSWTTELTADSLYCSLPTPVYTNTLNFFMIINVRIT